MKITHISLGFLRAELRTPFKTALRRVDTLCDLVVMITTDCEATGYGEAPPTAVITGETLESMKAAVRVIAPRLLGQDMANLPQLCQNVADALPQNSSAKAAVEIALYDLAAQAAGLPLAQFLARQISDPAPSVATSLESDLTVSVNSVERMCADAELALSRGFRKLKVKIGTDWQQDLERVSQIEQVVDGRAEIALDVNQGWNLSQSIDALRAFRSRGIRLALVEQPVKAQELAALKNITAERLYPILADEAVFSPADAEVVLSSGSADMVNIKLMKSAGLSGAMQIAHVARRYHAKCMAGCMLESAISVGAAAHFAAANADVMAWVDLDGPALCKKNPVIGGCVFAGNRIELNQEPGLGIYGIEGLEIFEVL